ALRHLDTAFAHCFRRCKLKQEGRGKGKVGYPQPKTKKRGLGSVRLTGTITVSPTAVQLPRLGWLRLKERGYLPTAHHRDSGRKDPLGDRAGAGGALVCLRPGGAGTGSTPQQRPGGGGRPGRQDAGHPLREDGHGQSYTPQAPPEEDQTLAARGFS